MDGLPERQGEVYGYILRYHGEHGYGPSLDDIAWSLGMGVTTVRDHLKALRKKGYVDWSEWKHRSLRAAGSGGGA